MSPGNFFGVLENDIVSVLSPARMPTVLSTSLRVTKGANWVQAERELDPLWTLIQAGSPDGPKDWIEWLLVSFYRDFREAKLRSTQGRVKGVRIGIDARMLSHEKSLVINAKISSLDSKMVYPPQNLVDLIWKNKPPKSKAPVFKQEIEYTGNLLASVLF